MFTAHYCVPPHCNDFTDIELCVFLVSRTLSLFCFIIIVVVLCIFYRVMLK